MRPLTLYRLIVIIAVMKTILIIIYFAFISLGLPDSLLGSAWPALRLDIGADVSMAGVLSMFISGCTIISSLNSARLIHRFRTSRITVISVFLTAFALMGYSFSNHIVWLFVLAVPLGLGGGCIDSGLNNFVALHYEARHMSWLHSFWGVGATLSPFIISIFIQANNWRGGYRFISLLQFALFLVMLVTLPKWKAVESGAQIAAEKEEKFITNREALKLPGAIWALLTFIAYCSVEMTTGLWSATYLTETRGMSAAAAAAYVSLYYGGITGGRLLTGFLTQKMDNDRIIACGVCLSAVGTVLYMLPLPQIFAAVALVLIGLGFAPVFPCSLHQTPIRYGKAASQTMMGMQMGFAYIGSTFAPLLFGFLAGNISPALLPYFLLAGIALLLLSARQAAKVKAKEA